MSMTPSVEGSEVATSPTHKRKAFSPAKDHSSKDQRQSKKMKTIATDKLGVGNRLKELEIKAPPSAQEISEAIPDAGIPLNMLTEKFLNNLDETNVHLYCEILKQVGEVDSDWVVKRRAQQPNNTHIDLLVEAAKRPHAPLLKYQTMKAELTGAIEVTYYEIHERIRGASNVLPPRLIRVAYEDSTTLSAYNSAHNHGRHVEKPELALEEGIAFQAYATFLPKKDLTRPRIERHLVWNKKADPSTYISAFSNITDAKRRAETLARKSTKVAQRIILAELRTSDLVAITIKSSLKETITTAFEHEKAEDGSYKAPEVVTTTREVTIPAWMNKAVLPTGGSSPLSLAELVSSGAEIFLSITELRLSNLKVPAIRGHSYEWLACGVIPESRIMKIMPFDGVNVHEQPGPRPVISLWSQQPWVFKWSLKMWRLDAELWGKSVTAWLEEDNEEGIGRKRRGGPKNGLGAALKKLRETAATRVYAESDIRIRFEKREFQANLRECFKPRYLEAALPLRLQHLDLAMH